MMERSTNGMRKLQHLAISAEGFVFNPATGDSFQLSQTGLAALTALRDGLSDAEVARRLAEEFEVSREDARRDLEDFHDSLRALGLE